ncbi:MAG: molybdenum cofactor guanylyltransferase [Bacteroidetes bacterium]|nr:molybdenum cofactor guanylyltransferase [Bacteroidota bacterium]
MFGGDDTTPQKITAAILAGGRSTRMGRDKAMISVNGRPMLERVAGAAYDAGLEVMVVGREQGADWHGPAVRFVQDDFPDAGPLGGIATALRHARTPVLALACDMPWISAEMIRWLVDAYALEGEAAGLVSLNGERPEPLFSVYGRPCAGEIAHMIASGNLAVIALIRTLGLPQRVVPERFRSALRNVNTPLDLGAVGL